MDEVTLQAAAANSQSLTITQLFCSDRDILISLGWLNDTTPRLYRIISVMNLKKKKILIMWFFVWKEVTAGGFNHHQSGTSK